MKPTDKTSSKIKLSKTFFRIEKGEAQIGETVARKRAERDAAKEDAKKKGIVPDATDPFMGNFGR